MVKQKLWKSNRTSRTEDAYPKVPLTLEITEIERSLARIAAKANNVLSSPIRKTMDSVRRDVPALFWEDKQHRIQSEMLYRRVSESEMITKKPHGRKRAQMGERTYGEICSTAYSGRLKQRPRCLPGLRMRATPEEDIA